MDLKTIDVITICGQRGTGKSTLFRMIAVKTKKLVVYDPLFEHGRLGVTVAKVGDIGNLDKAVFQPVKDTEEVFEEFCGWVFSRRDNAVIAVDEVDTHCTSNYIPPNASRLVRLGRHKGLGFIGITRRIADVNKKIPALSHHIISFRQTLPNDVGYLADFIGWKNAAKLRKLPDYHYLHFNWRSAEIGRTHAAFGDKNRMEPEEEEKEPSEGQEAPADSFKYQF